MYAAPVTSYPRRSKYPNTKVEWLYMITLWQPRVIRRRMATAFTAKAGNGESIFAIRGAAIRIPKIPAIESKPWDVLIPKSACLRTSTARSTVTPTTLLSLPVNLVKRVTTATQNAITRYTLKL